MGKTCSCSTAQTSVSGLPNGPEELYASQPSASLISSDDVLNVYTFYAPFYYHVRRLGEGIPGVQSSFQSNLPADRSNQLHSCGIPASEGVLQDFHQHVRAFYDTCPKIMAELRNRQGWRYADSLRDLLLSIQHDLNRYSGISGHSTESTQGEASSDSSQLQSSKSDPVQLCQLLAKHLKRVLDEWVGIGIYLLANPRVNPPKLTSTLPPQTFLDLLPSICEDVVHHNGHDFEILRELNQELCVFSNNATEYTLRTKGEYAQDPNDDDTPFPENGQLFRIISYPDPDVDPDWEHFEVVPDEKSHISKAYPNLSAQSSHRQAQVFRMSSHAKDEYASSPGSPTSCVLALLGWLAERKIQDPKEQQVTTYYQVLLNLSTDPVSVWVMYNYHIFNWPSRWTTRLGPYTNLLFKNPQVDYKPENSTQFLASERCPSDYISFRDDYTNVKDMLPKAQKEDVTKAPDKALSHLSATDEPANNGLTENLEEPSNEPGYFGLRQRFDLALLAPDIKTWKVDGLNPGQVKTCLESSHVRLGASMQQENIGYGGAPELLKSRVNIERLCFD
ncbi:MAG: hypothetical protein Q9225_003546 [Loekoesia sp. 1 TL-2023]